MLGAGVERAPQQPRARKGAAQRADEAARAVHVAAHVAGVEGEARVEVALVCARGAHTGRERTRMTARTAGGAEAREGRRPRRTASTTTNTGRTPVVHRHREHESRGEASPDGTRQTRATCGAEGGELSARAYLGILARLLERLVLSVSSS